MQQFSTFYVAIFIIGHRRVGFIWSVFGNIENGSHAVPIFQIFSDVEIHL